MSSERHSGPASDFGWIILVLYVLAVAMLGGSSRYDAMQLAALRPLAALFLIPALYYFSRDRMAKFRVPLIFLLGLTAWMLLQLIPLPPVLWQQLPGRGPITDLGIALDQTDVWRPISMVPTQTINSLAGMIIPIVALLLFAALAKTRRAVTHILIAVGTANAVLGILQIALGNSRTFYFYAVSNFGTPVGFFANVNHSAAFGAVILLLTAVTILDSRRRRAPISQIIGLAVSFIVVLLANLVSGSRAGLAATFLAVIVSGFLLWAGFRAQRSKSSATDIVGAGIKPQWLIAVAVAGMIATFVMFDRVPALSRIADGGMVEDIRWRLLPVLRDMIATYGLLGSGFGSFEEVYHLHETAELLMPNYVNQAHNDWAQFVIEGGIPAVLLGGVLAQWLVRSLLGLLRNGGGRDSAFWAAIFAAILFASAFDYPLRTPLFQCVAVWLLAIFAVRCGELGRRE